MNKPLQTQAELLSDLQPASPYVLTHLDIYNWGPFNGRHCAEIDIQGTAIIGPTGSGKTTLVDAFMTLLSAQPRYNLASTGGHESDRDLVSYVRGVAGAGNASGDNEHIARPGKTFTAIGARFNRIDQASAGQGVSLQIAAMFWLDGSSSATNDLKRLWIFSTAEQQSFDDWLELHHSGGAPAVKQLGRNEPGLQIFDSKKAFLAQLRRFFEVGENAFTLLNRAAGLKQLNSIDDIFRELVLDDHAAFNRAAEVASEFDDLAAIHEELETARRQQQSLLPIEQEYQRYVTHNQQRQLSQQLLHGLPFWFAEQGHALWQARCEQLQNELQHNRQQAELLAEQLTHQEQQRESLRDSYLQAGGANIEQLQELINTQSGIVTERQRHADEYQKLARALALDDELSAAGLSRNQAVVSQQQQAIQQQLEHAQQQMFEQGAERQNRRQQREELQQEWHTVSASDSNIPGPYQAFQTALAGQLGVAENQLPYVAELVEVKPEQSAWRGAIERAIGSHRLRLLVPPQQIKQALAWVNQRHSGLHVRLLEARDPTQAVSFFDDGFTRKLNFKEHPLRQSLKQLLADNDRHCVESAETLQHTAHAMTEQGLMSSKLGYFDKQDQRRLQDDWMTGFDNKDRLAALQQQIEECDQALRAIEIRFNAANQQVQMLQQQSRLLNQLADLRFETIDLEGAQQTLNTYQQRLSRLQDPESDTEKARLRWQQADEAFKSVQAQANQNHTQAQLLQREMERARQRQQRAFKRIGPGLNDEQRQRINQHYPAPAYEQAEELDELERQATTGLQEQLSKLSDQVATSERKLSVLMEKAKKLDTGALSEAGSELVDVEAYLTRLQTLTQEALPEKLQRFLAYLNQSSDQGVTQMLSSISNEVTVIEERIEDLNNTMRRVDFQPGRYLRLEPRHVTHESLSTLQKAQRQLRAAELKDDQGESHYKALAHIVALLRDASDRRKTLGARALLDPRYRLQFAVSVIARDSGAVIETRTGSQGGSGGEKEIIASYILTASLSYALCPDGASKPLFGTIVLDEAFSKSSQAVAGRIISALQEFGLHPLFITPNKEMRLLRSHTRSAVLIHRRGLRATMTSLSWEELEQRAQQHAQQHLTSTPPTPDPQSP